MTLNIIKVGGGIVEKEESLNLLLNDFSLLQGPKLLVHGGGRLATTLATQLGIETHMIEGRRVTDADMLRVVTMVYGGLVNKRIVAQLQARGINALGLTGADCNTIRSHRRPPVETVKKQDNSPSPENPLPTAIDYGFVGDIDCCDGDMLATLIRQGITPVVAPLTHDGHGQLLNTNADTIASAVAKSLAPHFDVTLTFCFEKKGVLRDASDEDSVIPHITAADFALLRQQGIVADGMVPKLENALSACQAGVKRVVITRADLLGQPDSGTVVTYQ